MLINKIERLNILLESDVIKSTAMVIEYVDTLKIEDREQEIDREEEVRKLEEVKELDEEQVEELLDKLYEIESEIEDLLEFNPRLLVTEELLEVNGFVYEYNQSKSKFQLSKEIYESIKNEDTLELSCWNCETERYEGLIVDKSDYDRLKNLNIIKKLYEKDSWIYKLYFLDKDLHLKPLDNYLLENQDYTMVCVCRNGNIHDLRKENWTLVKHPLLQQDFLEEVDSAKKLGQWLQDNGYTSDGEKLTKEIMELAEEKAKETIELLEEAEEILNENNIDIERDDINE